MIEIRLMKLITESHGEQLTRARRHIEVSLRQIDPEYRNAFVILEESDGNYVQAIGRQWELLIETRQTNFDGTFRHYRYCSGECMGRWISVPGSDGAVIRTDESEVLQIDDALKIFEHFRITWGAPHPEYRLRDITNQFENGT